MARLIKVSEGLYKEEAPQPNVRIRESTVKSLMEGAKHTPFYRRMLEQAVKEINAPKRPRRKLFFRIQRPK